MKPGMSLGKHYLQFRDLRAEVAKLAGGEAPEVLAEDLDEALQFLADSALLLA